jgi:hypothetical protein
MIILFYSFINSIELIKLTKIDEQIDKNKNIEKLILFVSKKSDITQDYKNIIIEQSLNVGDQDVKTYLKCNSHVALRNYEYDACVWLESIEADLIIAIDCGETDAVVADETICRKRSEKTTHFNREWYFNQKKSLKEIALKMDYSILLKQKQKQKYVIEGGYQGTGITNSKIEFATLFMIALKIGGDVVEPLLRSDLHEKNNIPFSTVFDVSYVTRLGVGIVPVKKAASLVRMSINPIKLYVEGIKSVTGVTENNILHIGNSLFSFCKKKYRNTTAFINFMEAMTHLAEPHASYVLSVQKALPEEYVTIHARLEKDWKNACIGSKRGLVFVTATDILKYVRGQIDLRGKRVLLICGDISKSDREVFEPCQKRHEFAGVGPHPEYTYQSLYDFDLALHSTYFFGHHRSTQSIAIHNERKKLGLHSEYYG